MSKYITYSIRRLDIKINRRHRVICLIKNLNYINSSLKLENFLILENYKIKSKLISL
jgi:hypothetical protein